MSASRLPASEHSLLVLAAVAGGGLARADFAALTGHTPGELDTHLATASRAGLGRRASRWTGDTIHLVEDGKQRRDIMAAAGEALLTDCRDALHAWADTHRKNGWPATTPEYLLDGYFHLLESTGDLAHMTACATDPRRHERLAELTGGTAAAVYEVAACQAAIAEQTNPDLAAAFTLAILREQLIVDGNAVSTESPATMATAGDLARAEQLASSITDPTRQVGALTKLAIALLDQGHQEQARHTINRLATVASTRAGPAPEAVEQLAAASQWTSAARIASSIDSQREQAVALRALVSAQIADGHLDQAEHLTLSLNAGNADHQALKSVIAALAAAGKYERAESLARAFPDYAASRDYGGILALPELTAALAVAGQDERFHKLIHSAPSGQIRSRLVTGAAAAMAEAGDFDRAENLARSIHTENSRTDALKEIVVQMVATGDVDRALALARSLDDECAALLKVRREPDRPASSYFSYIYGYRPRPGMMRALVNAGWTDLAESFAESISDEFMRARALTELAVALAASGNPVRVRADLLYAENRNRRGFDGLAVLTAVACAHVDAGNPDQAEQVAHSADTPLLIERILCHIAARLVEHGMTDRAERIADRLNDQRSQAAVLAAVAAASGAHDKAARLKLAVRVATPKQLVVQPDPVRLLRLAEALVQAGEDVYAMRVTERAVVLLGTTNDGLLSKAAVVLARAGAVSRAEGLARTLSFWAQREPALEAVATALAAAGDFGRAQSVAHDMANGGHKVSAVIAIASAMEQTGAHSQARELTYSATEVARSISHEGSRDQALHEIVRAMIAFGDLRQAEQIARSIRGYHEQKAALNAFEAELTADGDLRQAQQLERKASDASQDALRIIKNAANWLKEGGEKAAAAQLLADANAYTNGVSSPDKPTTVTSRTVVPDWGRQLFARALGRIGSHWDHLLTDLAGIDPAALHTVADVIAPRASISDPTGGLSS